MPVLRARRCHVGIRLHGACFSGQGRWEGQGSQSDSAPTTSTNNLWCTPQQAGCVAYWTQCTSSFCASLEGFISIVECTFLCSKRAPPARHPKRGRIIQSSQRGWRSLLHSCIGGVNVTCIMGKNNREGTREIEDCGIIDCKADTQMEVPLTDVHLWHSPAFML